ncbi:MAG: hypothetical protein KJO78_07465, partial [Alphaproteobacteria bacterium]|nr:hypothetical protein [Alphaproteobacteria bacterium]
MGCQQLAGRFGALAQVTAGKASCACFGDAERCGKLRIMGYSTIAAFDAAQTGELRLIAPIRSTLT